MFDIAHVDQTSPATTQEALDVQTAAAILDQLKPGWANLIDTDRLCLESHRYCVLGQVFMQEASAAGWPISGYGYGFQQLSMMSRPYWGLGFNTNVFASDHNYKHHWIAAIQQRTATPVVAA